MTYFAGVDIGSMATKCVIVNMAGEVVSSAVVATGARVSVAADSALAAAARAGRIELAEVARSVATGYGRKRANADWQITEITCHARGAIYFFPGTRTVLDIGGQDTKAIRLGTGGEVTNFAMNDKCAAGTGRFLEVMARALEIDLEDLGPLSLQSSTPQTISSFCTVFGETEVISHVADGARVADIALGLHEAISHRVVGLLKRVGVESELTMSGGVSRNIGMRRALEKALGTSFNVHPDAQLFGALGGALIGRDRAMDDPQ